MTMMPIEQWDREVAYHLKAMTAAANMVTAHVRQMPVRPDFETKAEHAVERCIAEREGLLELMELALVAYRGKEVER